MCKYNDKTFNVRKTGKMWEELCGKSMVSEEKLNVVDQCTYALIFLWEKFPYIDKVRE